MQVTLAATGTPAAVRQSVAGQLKDAGRATPSAWPTLAALRDYVSGLTAMHDPDRPITVTLTCTVAIAPAVPADNPARGEQPGAETDEIDLEELTRPRASDE